MTSVHPGRLAPAVATLLLALAAEAQSTPADSVAWSHAGLPVQHLELPEEAGGALFIDLQIEGETYLVELWPYSLRHAEFVLRVQEADGQVRIWEAPAPATYRGHVIGVEGSSVRASLAGGQLRGLIDNGAGESWSLQPLRDVDAAAPRSAHVVAHDSRGPELGEDMCGVHAEASSWIAAIPQALGTGFRVAEVALDADVEFYQLNGSSVTNTVNDIENVMNGVENIYENDLDVTFEITQIIVRTVQPDPYTTSDPGDLLTQFSQEWSGANQNGWQRDLAHLMTGRNLSGSTIGIASLGCLCGNCYGLSQSRWTSFFNSRVALTAHEMGHQFGASHCNGAAGGCNIMCSGLGGCSGIITSFAPVTINTITNSLAFKPCVIDLGAPVALPISENFDGGALDQGLWLVNDDTVISSAASGEPSAPNSLNLDGTSPNLDDQDELWTNDLLLAGGPWFLSYFSQHVGVGLGGALVVDYRNGAGDWVEFHRLTSDGIDQLKFAQSIVALPAPAAFDGGRLRFRTEVSDSSEDWFIDDVTIGSTLPCPSPITYCTGKLNSDGCVPLMTFEGSPSLTDPNPFLVSAFLVNAMKPGLLIYGYGPAAIPFQDGTLCIEPPLRRTPVQFSGGALGFPCDGTFAFDMNEQIQSGIDPFLVEGATGNVQFWYRDSLVPSQTGLTDAVQFEICP